MFICNIRSLATNGRLRYDVVRNANLRFNITAAPTVATNITIVRGHNIRRIRTRAPARVQLTLLTFVLSIHFCRVPLHAYTIQPTRWIYCLLHIIAMCDVLYLRFLEYVEKKTNREIITEVAACRVPNSLGDYIPDRSSTISILFHFVSIEIWRCFI